MVSCEEPMQLSDDENPNEINNTPEKALETIVIEDESSSQKSTLSENNNIIEINDSDYTPNKTKVLHKRVCHVYKENKLLAEFIEKCLDLENSEGMLRVINKNLLKAYQQADEKFTKSLEFERILIRKIKLLETEPYYKFSHVKNLCQALKSLGTKKKRVELVTLATNITNSTHRGRLKGSRSISNKLAKRQNTETVIDLDFDQTDIPIINLDDQNDVIVLDDPMEKENSDVSKHSGEKNISQDNIVLDVPVNVNKEKENRDVNEENNEENRFLEAQLEVPWEPDVNTYVTTAGARKELVAFAEIPITYEPEVPTVDGNLQKIKTIEDQIAFYREAILKLDESEVCDDTDTSPYIQSERIKASIVDLYKQLCELTGDEPVKRRTVRLDVLDGHPPGPVRRLEVLINDNIGDNGQPHFPDFSDVVKCVIEANEVDGLGWTKARIMKEAIALFTQCGRALQKKRQRRAYRDMLSFAKSEPDSDPADRDPGLLAKLQENRRVALMRENELLERYTVMQNNLSKVTRPRLRSECVQNVSNPLECNSDGSDMAADIETPIIPSLNNNISKSETQSQDLKTNTQCLHEESRSTVQTDLNSKNELGSSSHRELTHSDIHHTINSILQDHISRHSNGSPRLHLNNSREDVDANIQVHAKFNSQQHTKSNFDDSNKQNDSVPKWQPNLHFTLENKTEVAQNDAISNLETNSFVESIAKSIVAGLQSCSVPGLQTHSNLEVKIEVGQNNAESKLEIISVIEGIAQSVLRRHTDLKFAGLESKSETLETHSNSGIETLGAQDNTVTELETHSNCIRSLVRSPLEPRVGLNVDTVSNGDSVVYQTHFDVQAQVRQNVSILQTQIELNSVSLQNNTTGTDALKIGTQNISELQTQVEQCNRTMPNLQTQTESNSQTQIELNSVSLQNNTTGTVTLKIGTQNISDLQTQVEQCNRTMPNSQTQTKSNLQTQIEPNTGSLLQCNYMETDNQKIRTQTNTEETQVTQRDCNIESNVQSKTVPMLQTQIDSKTWSPKCNTTEAVVPKIETQKLYEVNTLAAQDNDVSKFGTQIDPNLQTPTESNVQTQIESNTESLQIENAIETVVPEVKIKQEPIDIVALLKEFGDNYTYEIDIIDPFLVIEISSDSSDGEDM